ncbi:MAG: IclR family transcriptional regulator C-terminal domain-containing protein [Xanthobacteraceae bacterium]|nr:IclR family transcriptional regulator C-terminal domain-containing protein [Xanthobacteraceae bacterium]
MLSARALMAITGLPKPTLFRLTGTLCDLGLLRYDEAVGRFTPAPGVARLAAPLLARTSIRQLAFGPMQALAERLRAQVALSLGFGLDLVFIELAQAKECVTVRPSMGGPMSLSRTASGRAYLSVLAAEQRQAYLDELRLVNRSLAERLDERLREAREDLDKRGFCVSYGELIEHFHGVAVPLKPVDGSGEIYVFNCAVPSFELQPDQLLNDVGPRLLTLARSIEAALGAPSPFAGDMVSPARGPSSARAAAHREAAAAAAGG